MKIPAECSAMREWLSAYLDGEIESNLRAQLDAHLAGCAACRSELKALRRTSVCLHVWQVPDAAPELSARFAERLAERAQRQPIWQRLFTGRWQRAAWACGSLAACALTFCLLTEQSPHQYPPPVRTQALRVEDNRTKITVKENSGKAKDRVVIAVVPRIAGETDVRSTVTRIQDRLRSIDTSIRPLHKPDVDKKDNSVYSVSLHYKSAPPPAAPVPDAALTAVNALTETASVPANETGVDSYDSDGSVVYSPIHGSADRGETTRIITEASEDTQPPETIFLNMIAEAR